METINKKKFNCIICDKTFLTSKKLQRHIAGTHNQETYECDKCNKSFTYKGNLNHHLQKYTKKSSIIVMNVPIKHQLMAL